MEDFKYMIAGAWELMQVKFTVLGIELTLWNIFVFAFLLYALAYFLFKLTNKD